MTKDSDRKNKLIEDNESMVKALESIKSLLATSEDKLNKARESIDQASSFTLRNDNNVPVLDDIIVPGKSADIEDEEPQLDFENTQLVDVEQEPLPDFEDTQLVDISPEQEEQPQESLSDALVQLKMELENEMHEKLIYYAAQLEEDLKAKIQIFIEQHSNKK